MEKDYLNINQIASITGLSPSTIRQKMAAIGDVRRTGGKLVVERDRFGKWLFETRQRMKLKRKDGSVILIEPVRYLDAGDYDAYFFYLTGKCIPEGASLFEVRVSRFLKEEKYDVVNVLSILREKLTELEELTPRYIEIRSNEVIVSDLAPPTEFNT